MDIFMRRNLLYDVFIQFS